jgi:hypothetical protein
MLMLFARLAEEHGDTEDSKVFREALELGLSERLKMSVPESLNIMTREQLVAIVTALLVHMDGPVGRFDRPPLASYASGALEIVQAAERAVAEEKGT